MKTIASMIKKTSPHFYFFMLKLKLKKDAKNPITSTKKRYKTLFNVDLNLDNPTTFYEKINYLKLFGSENDYSSMLVDKERVKAYVAKLGYGSHCAMLLDSFEDIKGLKNYVANHKNDIFVVKNSHTSGDVFFYTRGKWKNKSGENVSKKYVYTILKINLKINYYYLRFEKPYLDIPHKIIVEEYLEPAKQGGLEEYKFFCNYGQIKMINIVRGRQSGDRIEELFVDKNLKSLGVHQKLKLIDDSKIEPPSCYKKMVKFAEESSRDYPILRVDLMTNGNEFYFCEFTFYDCAGFNIFYPIDKNTIIGDLFEIKLKNRAN